jgi:hypothetical protein
MNLKLKKKRNPKQKKWRRKHENKYVFEIFFK